MATRTSTKTNRARAQAANAGRRKRRRHGKRTLHYILLVLFLLVAGAVLSLTVFFKIEEVVVIGVDRYAPNELIEVSGIELGENLLKIDKAEITAKLLDTFPYLDTVKIRRKFPPAVEISVTQLEPFGAIVQDGEVTLIDRWGKVLDRGVFLIPEGIPAVKGIDITGAQPGDTLGAYTPPKLALNEEMPAEELAKQAQAEGIQERLRMLRYLLDAMEESEFQDLTNVDLSDRLNMQIIYENRITLKLGSESQMKDKLVMVRFVLENYIDPEETGTLDATDIARGRVIFAPASGQAESQIIALDELSGEDEDEPAQEGAKK